MKYKAGTLHHFNTLIILIALTFVLSLSAKVGATQPKLILTVQTDKQLYQPGETVKIFGTVKDSNNNPIEGATVSIEVKDPRNNTIFLDIVFTSSNGTYQDTFRLHTNTTIGDYQVFATATATGYQTAQSQTTFSVGIHDIAIINIKSDPATPSPGTLIRFNVTVQNQGNFTETFNVSLFYTRISDPLIGTQTITLNSQTTTTLTFDWTPNTTGRYHILANTTEIPNDIDPTDNTRTTIIYVGYNGSNLGSHNNGQINGVYMVGLTSAMFASIIVFSLRKNKETPLSDIPASILRQYLHNNLSNNQTNMWKDKPTRQLI